MSKPAKTAVVVVTLALAYPALQFGGYLREISDASSVTVLGPEQEAGGSSPHVSSRTRKSQRETGEPTPSATPRRLTARVPTPEPEPTKTVVKVVTKAPETPDVPQTAVSGPVSSEGPSPVPDVSPSENASPEPVQQPSTGSAKPKPSGPNPEVTE